MSVIKKVKVGDREIQFEFHKYAKQANAAVMVSCGDTQVLVTTTASASPKEGQDFFPLTVDYIEKFYAAGKIPGGFIKRETKPSDRETLTARVIDRPLRPSFPEGYMNDTHIVCTVVSLDPKHHPASLALVGASAALMISDIPFNGPVASIRLGMKDGEFVVDPGEMEVTDLDLNIAARPGAILMVEAGANFLSEEKMLDAFDHALKLMQPLFDMQIQIQKEFGVEKMALSKSGIESSLKADVEKIALKGVVEAYSPREKKLRGSMLSDLGSLLKRELNPEGKGDRNKQIEAAFEDLKYRSMRTMILDESKRIDGRGMGDIRPIVCDVGPLKRPHGSALFQRGETQALAAVTLGAAIDEQRMDSILTPDASKKFMLHYNFPPYSVGEARAIRPPGRREIGHGALAERALSRVLPDNKKFAYTIRLVSEVLESNGSSSMATVCAGTMAMLHAGVPLTEPVAGIAMGLIKEGSKYAILSDILGDEDHLGDMDFKVCGGTRGITALQMDIKIDGLSREILEKALAQAKVGRAFILQKLTAAISTPGEISQYAPQIFQIKINTDRVRDLIGPGGKMIKKIVAETGVKIDIEDSGMVNIVAFDNLSAEAAKKMIREVTSDPEVGAIFLGTVKKIVDFGAFVEIKPGVEGLCHISQLDNKRVERVTDVIKEGEEILVKLLEIDRQGKMKLSRKEALTHKPTV